MFQRKRIPDLAWFPIVFILLLPGACTTGPFATALPAGTDAYRASPEASQPAAGICASFKEEIIRVAIRAWPDGVPEPRCIKVRTDQKLVIANGTGKPIEFRLGKFYALIEPGGSYAIDVPFGEYLAPGAHSLHVQPYGGPEIFFEG
jgi:hypothetical protein